MALFERFTGEDPDEDRRITEHTAAAGMGVVALGMYTLNELKAYWNTNAGDNADLAAIVAHVGPMTQEQRMDWLKSLEWLLIMRQDGAPIDAATIRTKLGL